MRQLLAIAALLVPCAAQATSIYRYVDDEGNVVFSSQPPVGRQAERVTLPPVNAVSAPQTLAPSKTPPAQADPAKPYPGFRIVAPENDTSVRANDGNFNITLHTDQPLRPSHQVVLIFDGAEVARGAALTFTLKNVDRGTHTAQARIVDQAGNEVAAAEPVTFTVQRVAVGGAR